MNAITIGMVGTYPPTRCGIATFTQSLDTALQRMPGTKTLVIEPVFPQAGSSLLSVAPASAVDQTLINGDPASIRRSARRLDAECDVVIVQHEFGIYGGPEGAEVLQLLTQLAVPIVLVLHTVLDDPNPVQRSIIEQACSLARHVVVMSDNAEKVLLSSYSVDPRAVRQIPHGVFSVHRQPTAERLGTSFRALTWGLLGPGKGIEWMIMALALVPRTAVDLRYRVLGQTHPKVREREGEGYRRMLMRLSDELEVSDRVEFLDEYLDRDALADEIGAADLVVLPYDSRVQATSGVLAEALAARIPVIATRFPYAREMIPHGQGWLVPHQDPRSLADALEQAMRASTGAARLPWPSRFRGPSTDWADVALMYRRLVDRAVSVKSA